MQGRAKGEGEQKKKNKLMKAILALSICHNVTPVIDNDVRGLEGSSPD